MPKRGVESVFFLARTVKEGDTVEVGTLLGEIDEKKSSSIKS